MRSISLTQIIKNQIRKELNRKEIIKEVSSKIAQEEGLFSSQTSNLSQDKIEQQLFPLMNVLFNHRIISGGEPVKLVGETGLKLYVNSLLAVFDDEESIKNIGGQEVTLNYYSEDRWVYVYLNEDETFEVNKYPPFIGTNTDRIVICKVWIEKNATTYEAGSIRDLRPVGVASANLNHILRQAFVHLMHAIPATIIDTIQVIPHIATGGLFVSVGAFNDKLFYGKLNPIPDTIVQIPLSETGETKNYYIVCSAQVSDEDPDDFVWNIKAIEDSQDLKIYEIPIAMINGVTSDTTEITVSMIEKIGYQRTKDDYFSYDLEFNFKQPDNSEGDMLKSTYDINADGIVDKAKELDDGAGNTATASDAKDAVSKKHTQNTDTHLGTVDADIDMNSHKLTDLSVPLSEGDSIRATMKITESNLEDSIDKKHNHNIIFTVDTRTTGTKCWIRIPFDCVIVGWELTADQSGSLVVDIWKDVYDNFPPTDADSICVGSEPFLITQQKNSGSPDTGWSVFIDEGDYLMINVDSVTDIQKAVLILKTIMY